MPLWNVTFLSCSLLGNKFTDRDDPGDPVLKLPPKLAQGISGVCYLGAVY